MSQPFRFDLPPEIVLEREQIFGHIFAGLSQQTREGLEQAIGLYREWMLRFPDDYATLDFGSTLAMSEAAYEAAEWDGEVERPHTPRELSLNR